MPKSARFCWSSTLVRVEKVKVRPKCVPGWPWYISTYDVGGPLRMDVGCILVVVVLVLGAVWYSSQPDSPSSYYLLGPPTWYVEMYQEHLGIPARPNLVRTTWKTGPTGRFWGSNLSQTIPGQCYLLTYDLWRRESPTCRRLPMAFLKLTMDRPH